MFRNIKELTRETNIGVILGSGSSVNDLIREEWNAIRECDTLGINNWFYHPKFIPKMLSLELKTYDFQISKDRIAEKWELGWKNVKYLLNSDRAHYVAEAIGHPKEAQIYSYEYRKYGEHPKINPNVKIDANFDPSGPLMKCFDVSLSTLIHLMYKMGYEYIVLYGVDITDSKYFWSSGDKKYGKTHCLTNKDHEGKKPNLPHNTSHIVDFVIDFNKKHMKPQGREILVGYKKTPLYPLLNYVDLVKKEIHR